MLLVLLFGMLGLVGGYIVDPGPRVHATNGEIWPLPQYREELEGYFVVRPAVFKFKAIGKNCEILEEALERYWGIIVRYGSIKEKILMERYTHKQKNQHISSVLDDSNFHGYLDNLEVYLQNACDDAIPTFDMDESYYLNITSEESPKALLTAKSVWGTLRGLETFTQLIHVANDQTSLIINATNIHDFPRFPHRGLLLDTSRHFMPVPFILQTLDAMSYNKLNVFHWHIVDDQSFPYQSVKFPELSEKGAYHPFAIYTPVDVRKVLRHATNRGIRVIPEIDIPAHTRSWGVAVPEVLTRCYENGEFTGKYGPLDPTRNFTYSFLNDLLSEIADVFPDKYLHLGGDENDFDCWETNEELNNFMEAKNISGDYPALENYFFQRVYEDISNLSRIPILWEEVFTNNIQIDNSTIIQIWKDTDYIGLLKSVTSAGHYALLSSCWYLDHLQKAWSDMYECEPRDFPGTDEQKQLVLGGEACMWGESINQYNMVARVWPRASAVAEILWSAVNASDHDFASRRLEEHSCRMNDRGIPTEPANGPGFCL